MPDTSSAKNRPVKRDVDTASAIKIDTKSESITALKRLLTYYQEITETITDPFLILDKDLVVVTANQAFYSIFRATKLATEGKMIYDLGDKQWDSPELRELLENILPKHKLFNSFEITHKLPGIGKRTVLLSGRQIDQKQLILLAFQDITKRKKLDVDSAKMTKSLIKQKDTLQAIAETKDEFISMASHQLRTPATAVKLYTAMLKDGYAGDMTEPQLKMLQIAIDNNERQLEIIEDMLRVARTDDGKVYLEKVDCDVTSLLQAVITSQLGMYKGRDQKVVFETAGKTFNARIDTELMRMVFENLLDNASKYSHDEQEVGVTLKQVGDKTIITFSDQGVGVMKKDQKKMFMKFSRLNNSLSLSTTGTGLGLYWVKKIMELHHGSITVISKVEEGTTFTLTLPTYSELMDSKVVEFI